jgi:H+/Cl- antiporter ClcA
VIKSEKISLNFFALIVISSIIIGLCSAFFLFTLDLVSDLRENNNYLIYFLPLAGFSISWIYSNYGQSINNGNKFIIKEFHHPQSTIPLKMAPFIYFGTLITHLFGGSAGREGTAVQIAASVSDNLKALFKISNNHRKLLLKCSMAAGFSSVFGTPLSAVFFAKEVLKTKDKNYIDYTFIVLSSFIAHFSCLLTGIKHKTYTINYLPHISIIEIVYIMMCGVIFGITSLLFIKLIPFWKNLFSPIRKPHFQAALAGLIISTYFHFTKDTRYLGLGIQVISDSFTSQVNYYDFFAKIIFTTLTISLGFKGGEVTPLFFIGATLGNSLGLFIPLNFSLLAVVGMVSVFCGATKTPLTSCFIAAELFGWKYGLLAIPACAMAHFFSGNKSIYN